MQANVTGVVLCVDDEPHILSALRRLFRTQGYEVVSADSGRAGLEVLASRQVDLIISDMRMPEMDGVAFLEQARQHTPDTMRVLLTGHADVSQILDAVNRGEIYRYITKPWDDHEMTLVVRHALERQNLERDRRRLEALSVQQNEQLRELNQSLEAKVASRTAELVGSNDKLKRNFLTSIQVFSSLIELRGENLAGHSRRVADLARRIALRMGLDARETQQIFIAGLLHNIGKIGFSDSMLDLPVPRMNGELLGLYRSYPARGEQLLMPLEDLRDAATLVRAHQERFDGEGFPDRLAGLDIPIGARILALASDYDNLQIGTLSERQLRPDQAAKIVIESSGKRYDPAVVAAFGEVTTGKNPVEALRDTGLPVAKLKPGMRTTRDLVTKEGSLLLSADHVLTERMIRQIGDFERTSGSTFLVYVKLKAEAA
ncbi:response regulator [Massilia sp. R2A-15]|uniref:HD domain-containing phosphohydrolase n=1 Tax=Massilia sp. R2A-15 TaxID=3064278 RepID=UPI002735D6E0|nr:HD domain-containing phosphohydrolase [Massilia sp. R2A-15]WLI91361.1 response regulator [Massilia sp. R2A-15]